MPAKSVPKTNYTMKVDVSTRDSFSLLCDKIGISMSSALNAMMKQAVRDQQMSFTLYDENGFTRHEAAEFSKRKNELEKGKGVKHPLVEEEL